MRLSVLICPLGHGMGTLSRLWSVVCVFSDPAAVDLGLSRSALPAAERALGRQDLSHRWGLLLCGCSRRSQRALEALKTPCAGCEEVLTKM